MAENRQATDKLGMERRMEFMVGHVRRRVSEKKPNGLGTVRHLQRMEADSSGRKEKREHPWVYISPTATLTDHPGRERPEREMHPIHLG